MSNQTNPRIQLVGGPHDGESDFPANDSHTLDFPDYEQGSHHRYVLEHSGSYRYVGIVFYELRKAAQ